jgi:fluoride exporter
VSGVALWVGVGALGGLASIARFLLDAAVSSARGGRFPLGTLVVNLTGATVLGLLVGIGVHGEAYLLAGTAVIGSYTTFSTWLLESHRLAEDGAARLLAANLGLSLALGIAAVAAGRLLGGG